MTMRHDRLTPLRRDILIRVVAHQDAIPLRLVDIAKAIGLSNAGTHHHLSSLVRAGFLSHDSWGSPYRATEAGVASAVAKKPAMPDGAARTIRRCPNCGHKHYV